MAAADAQGNALQYQWRVTSGSIDNINSSHTVWTLPDGPGLHFAYVLISNGKGGYVEQQYAVSSDALGTTAPARAPVVNTPPAINDFSGSTVRLSFISSSNTAFTPVAGGTAANRQVYLADVPVQILDSTGALYYAARSDLGGDVDLPKLAAGQTYSIRCGLAPNAALVGCGSITAGTVAFRQRVSLPVTPAQNLRLFGHVGLADGALCGYEDPFFGVEAAATVSLLAADGTVLAPPRRVNRYGDYEIDAAVAANASLMLAVQCESYSANLAVPAAPAGGYTSTMPVELSHVIAASSRPQLINMVANGPDGNVRGKMVLPETGTTMGAGPGPLQFLTYKGADNAMSACLYYRALGAVQGCDAQGGMIGAISLDDWLRQHGFAPYAGTNAQVAATYVNRMDLNLVRQMFATQKSAQDIAFYVCNHPGPDGSSQAEVDAAIDTVTAGVNNVACVAMEWSVTPGVNNNQPFTKFLTFAPDGSLLASVNLDGRGEKYMPGTCVACHGGSVYNGRLPDQGNPSPYLGSGFLPFDTGNYLFSSAPGLSEAEQSDSIHALNLLVMATEASTTTPTSQLIQGWYASGSTTLDKNYLPPAWQAAEAATPGA
ncbi:MAG: hypothetical protein KGL43_04475, partial [Burkholderiales bacterium]|nr:hypothetical protein [Burkholderiales bacterium]